MWKMKSKTNRFPELNRSVILKIILFQFAIFEFFCCGCSQTGPPQACWRDNWSHLEFGWMARSWELVFELFSCEILNYLAVIWWEQVEWVFQRFFQAKFYNFYLVLRSRSSYSQVSVFLRGFLFDNQKFCVQDPRNF